MCDPRARCCPCCPTQELECDFPEILTLVGDRDCSYGDGEERYCRMHLLTSRGLSVASIEARLNSRRFEMSKDHLIAALEESLELDGETCARVHALSIRRMAA